MRVGIDATFLPIDVADLARFIAAFPVAVTLLSLLVILSNFGLSPAIFLARDVAELILVAACSSDFLLASSLSFSVNALVVTQNSTMISFGSLIYIEVHHPWSISVTSIP